MNGMENINWIGVAQSLDSQGYARTGPMLSEDQCAGVINLYHRDELFRSTIDMERYRFGRGEYRYFAYPLPPIIQTLREEIYSHLAPVANNWMERLETDLRFPADHETFLSQCHSKHQSRPTPLILRYEEDGYNTLHQDIYGEVFFPFQVVFVLTQSGRDHEGGELVFVEQLPRAQSRVEVLSPMLGEAVVLTTNFRPVKGSKGYYRGKMKHGVSPVKKGLRYSMGIIFHDAN
jgi:hypothetical protein